MSMWRTTERIAIAATEIMIVKAAIHYSGTNMPGRALLARVIERLAQPKPASLLERAARGCERAMWELQAEHPLLQIERAQNGGLSIKAL